RPRHAVRPTRRTPHTRVRSRPETWSRVAPRSRVALAFSAFFLGLDEDVDLVGALVVLLIDHGERRGVLAHLLVGVDGVLLGALRSVAEVPLELERTTLFLFDRGGELHLEGRCTLVRIRFR